MALVKRIPKGSALTATEHDGNMDHFTAAIAAEEAARIAADAGKAALAGATFTGPVLFSGTVHAGLTVLSLTTEEIGDLSPAPTNGTIIYDSTLGIFVARQGGEWVLWQSVPGRATLSQYLAGTDPTLLATVDVVRHMDLLTTRAHAATLTLDWSGERVADGDGADCDSLVIEVSDVGGDMDIQIGEIHAGLDGAAWSIRLVSDTAAAHDITVSTANGITVELAPGVTIPAMGSAIGDALTLLGSIVSTTKIVVERTITDLA